jgi:hypothetical protein
MQLQGLKMSRLFCHEDDSVKVQVRSLVDDEKMGPDG